MGSIPIARSNIRVVLEKLTVQNLAIVEFAEVEFASGLNVLTGETGAGKSVLMGALELVLGARAEGSMVRDGAECAKLEAVFSLEGKARKSAEAILEESGMEPGDGELIVKRQIQANGGGKIWINGESASAGTLKKLAKPLIDIHGARANQKILEEKFQREALDDYGETAKMAEWGEYREAWQEQGRIKAEIADLEGEGDTDEELDMLRYQVTELEESNLSEEDETIAERQRRAADAEDVIAAANEVTEALGGDGQSVAEVLIHLQPRVRTMGRCLEGAQEWIGELEAMCVKAQEISREMNRAAMALSGGEADLAELDKRLTQVNRLKRKYKAGTVAELMELAQKKRARLERLEGKDQELARLRGELAKTAERLKVSDAAIGERRRAMAEKIGKAVTKELKDLGFLQAKFDVKVESGEAAAHGMDKVTYMFEPNPGESARALSEIASAGEMARVMLALKSVLSAHDDTDVLVFDEIDANIGGETGKAVGEKMRKVARDHQVIAITHLPQSAVFGTRHLVVSKQVRGGRTRTMIAPVEGEARTAEIARMLGGEDLTTVTRQHAEELLAYGKAD